MNLRRVPFPHEHGAWAMLFAAVVLAWAHPWARGWPAAVLTLLFVLCFAIQEPLRAVAAGKRTGDPWVWIALYGGLLLSGTAWLVWAHDTYALIPAAAAGALLTGVDLALRRRKQHKSFLLRLFGSAGLTLVLPAVLALYHPDQLRYAFVLWLLTVAYFATRLLAVRTRNEVRRAGPAARSLRRAGWLAQAGLYLLLALLILAGQATPWVLAAFVPATLAALRPRTDLDLRRVGWREVAHLTWFVTALLLSFHLP